jgi:ubiquinone/menaquinone biosynthesis C-methylase UbiE
VPDPVGGEVRVGMPGIEPPSPPLIGDDRGDLHQGDLGDVGDVELRTGDAEALPFDDAVFDTVLCGLSLCTIPDPATAIGEMRRVLVPGGRCRRHDINPLTAEPRDRHEQLRRR